MASHPRFSRKVNWLAITVFAGAALFLPASARADEKTAGADGQAETLDWAGDEKIDDIQRPMVLDKRINPGKIKVDILEGADPDVKTQFDVALLSGDKDIVQNLQIWKDWEYKVAFAPVTNAEIKAFYEKLMAALREKGYVFAKVTFPTRIWPTGIFLAKVDCGPLGEVTVRGNQHYSAKQIVKGLGDSQVDGRFNYGRFYQDLFNMNANPDMTIDTKLKPVMRDGRRVIDAELIVEDNWPIHGAVEFSNSGTKETGDYRLRTGLQHNNLTKHNDTLNVEWLTDPENGDLNAYSGSYFIPFTDDWSFNIFGGYSESDLNDVLPELDLRGEGWFLGAQVTRRLVEDNDKRVQLSLGWMYQEISQDDELAGFDQTEREVTMSMPMLTLGYAAKTFDAWNGRNYLSATFLYHNPNHMGASEEDEFVNGDGNFLIGRFQFARFQKLFAGENAPGKWSLFMKVEGQMVSDPVDTSLQKSVGGADSVRGYVENELSGDDAIVASLELRTPLLQNFIPGLTKEDDYLQLNPNAWQKHRLQFVLFMDYAWIRLHDSEFDNAGDGRKDEESLLSLGAGLRLGLTKYSQLRFDWGFPLEDTDRKRDGGRGHFAVQLQF
ncbi:MAG: ShlB/FhaC/HecB family hemolysin secretion/activation protein [Lentisphaeria bacterium]|nr:ShlB/FhaC/HecB family hemolysin secretion/activation protein [Lentisphaeria bacterium]